MTTARKIIKTAHLSTGCFIAIIFAVLTVTGCDNRTSTPDSGKASKTVATETNIQLEPVSFQQWEATLADYQPNVVVVDAWAMWCTSCIKRFPHMVEMAEKYRNQGVQFVSLNLDDRSDTDALEDARQFLVKMNAKFDHFHMNEDLIEAFDRFNLIGIPAVFIYDGKGEERFRLTGDNPNAQFTEKDIEAAVKTLISEKT